MASTVLPNGIIIPEKYSRDWYNDLYHNWEELDNLLAGGGANDGTLTIQKNGTTVGAFSANQATDETVNIEVPDVNNGTLTIQKNGTAVGTFSANQATDETIDITVPDVNNGTLTIQQNGTTVDSFSANSSSDKTVNIQCVDLTSNQTVGGNKEFTGTTTAHDVVPSATDTYNFGSSSYQWNNAYIKSLTINGVAAGDILTHNASEFVNVSTAQTIAGVKSFSNIIYGLGSQIILRRNDVERTVLPASIVYTAFSFSDKVGAGTASRFGAVENVVKTNGDINLDLRAYDFSTKSNAHTTVVLERKYDGTSSFYPEQNNTVNLGTSANKWKSFNGLNPGALSLPSSSSISIDTTDWDLTCSNEKLGSFTPTADGWLMLHVNNSGTNEVNFWVIGGVIRINNKSSINTSDNRNFNMITIPVEKDKTYNIYGNASEYVTGRSIAYCRFMPCRGNV